ncbi:MAG: MBL fold metallo-hydrolase [Desulfobacterales bacterium]|nr:MBL fold metallo-hydrolase [Desulfobacterales bacterium]MCP4161374.1 MBL fold metallo-hydrolase [Deltaproteobacteria bacterium]
MLEFQEVTPKVHLVKSDIDTPWKCNGLIVKTEKGRSVLIDCNYGDAELDQIMDFVGEKPVQYFITHVHIDHVTNVHRIESRGIPVYCPEPEDMYIVSGELLMEHSGAPRYGLLEGMKSFLFNFAGFKNIQEMTPFKPSEKFIFDEVEIETILLPGHSPGHTGFIVRDLTGTDRPVLFSSDMGLEKIGAWYGFKYCDLEDVKRSLIKIEEIYEDSDFILTGSHCPVYFEKQNGIFKDVVGKIEVSKKKLLTLMGKDQFSPDDFVFKGVYYRTSSIDKMDEVSKKLYFFWEGYTIRNLFGVLEKDGLIIRSEDEDMWSTNISFEQTA